jgi:hypothetical protein
MTKKSDDRQAEAELEAAIATTLSTVFPWIAQAIQTYEHVPVDAVGIYQPAASLLPAT